MEKGWQTAQKTNQNEGMRRLKLSVCGKGGSGKSTVVSLLSAAAQAKGLRTLVVDSDESNSGLFRMLGFENPGRQNNPCHGSYPEKTHYLTNGDHDENFGRL